MLTHYTDSVASLVGILTKGFVYRAARRHLIESLVRKHSYRLREPQQFGMVSFTELSHEEARVQFARSLPFGISVGYGWASEHRAERVVYIGDDGPAHDAWRTLFQAGYEDLTARIKYPEDGFWLRAYENKVIAGSVVGAGVWSALLQLYEYMEAAAYSGEREWRIVNPIPNYSIPEPKEAAIENLLSPGFWVQHLNVVKILPQEVKCLVCPSEHYVELIESLPDDCANIPVVKAVA